MKKNILLLLFILFSQFVKAQKVDSLFFNLYTDSLKKGTLNYINVDAKYSNGRYLPLTEMQLEYTASAGYFERNSLFVPVDIKVDSIVITVTLKQNKSVSKSITLHIKKKKDDEKLLSDKEMLDKLKKKNQPK